MLPSVSLCILGTNASVAKAPTISNDMVMANENSLIATKSPIDYAKIGSYEGFPTRDEIMYIIEEKYPSKARLLECLVKNESQYCTLLNGDNGNAYGCFQIWISKHPISEQCALDFECSLDFTVDSINAGYGWWWTPWNKCNYN